jgi:hypothetical protein
VTDPAHRDGDGERVTPVSAALLDKVRKLLAKAEATDNGHEAEAFSAKAAALIAAHRIDTSRLGEADAADALAVRTLPIGRGAYVRARLALLQAVAEAHDCELVWQPGPDGATALLAGFSTDLDTTVVLYESLHLQAASRMAAVRRSTPAATQRWRRAFLFGYAARLAEVLVDARQRAEATAAAAATLLPDRPARVDRVRRYAASAFGRVVGARTPGPAVAGGWDRGHRAAGEVDIGRSRLAGRRALGRGAS